MGGGPTRKRMHAQKPKRHVDVSQLGLDELLAADLLADKNESEPANSSDSPDGSDEETSSGSEGLEFDQADIERLKDQDPDFYKYLKDTDEGLLEFRDDDDDDDEELVDGEPEADQDGGQEHGAGSHSSEDGSDRDLDGKAATHGSSPEGATITSESLKSWCRVAQNNASIGAVRQVTRLYRVACHFGDEDEDQDESMTLASSAVYNNILLFMLGKADGIFRKALGMAGGVASGSQREDRRDDGDDGDDERTAGLSRSEDPTKRERYSKYAPFIRSYLGNTLHLLDKVTDPSMQGYILKRLRHSVPFLKDFDKIRRKFIAVSLKIFSSDEDEPRVQAILFVRACAVVLPALCLDPCLKGVYRSFAAASKFFSPTSAPGIRFMATCAVEMYGIDLGATYQHAFVAIKGLAGQMRQALTSKSKESYKEVYCWQTINAFELWATVLVAHPSDLEPLFYPLTQLLLGACTLVGSPSFIPLRLKCVRMLNELARARNMYVPVAPMLLEVLQWKDLGTKPKPVPANSIPDLNLRLRVGSSILRASSFQEDVVDTTYELLSDHLAQWGSHPGFLEIAYIPLLRLRAFIKASNKDRFKRGGRQLCQAIVDTQDRVGKARNMAQFSPKDSASIVQFATDLESAGPAPIARLAITLREQAMQRMKMRSMQDVVLEDDESDEDVGEMAPREDDREEGTDSLPAKRPKRSGADHRGNGDEPRDESDGDMDDYEDRVETFQFSSDSE